MALKVHLVAALRGVLPTQEVVEGDFIESGRRGKGGDMSADALVLLVGLDHHRHRVPADEAPDPPFDFEIPGVGRFLGGRDGVDVGSIEWRGDLGAAGAEPIAEALKKR